MKKVDTQRDAKKSVEAAYAVALVEVRDLLFANSGADGVTLAKATETLLEDAKYRTAVAAKTPYLIREAIHSDFKRVFKESAGGEQYAYPIPLGGSSYRYKRLDDMTLAEADAWRAMLADRVSRIGGMLEEHDLIVDPLRPLLKKNPAMTIGEAKAARQQKPARMVAASS